MIQPLTSSDAARRRLPAPHVIGVVLLGLALPLTVVLSGAVGVADVSFVDSLKILLGHLLPDMPWMRDGSLTVLQDQAVWRFRLPRTLLAGVGGAGLALAGALMQVIVRNPLAEPYILGVSAGAGLGAVLVITAGSSAVAGLGMSSAAFAGALATGFAVYLLARQHGMVAPTRLILSGVAIGSLLSAVTSFLTLTTDAQNVFSVLFFLLGSVAAAEMTDIIVPGIVLLGVSGYALARARRLNALLAGDEVATALGVDANRFRARLMIAAALLTGAVVSVSGGIGFIGLVVPHVARIAAGSNHRRMLPLTILGGALFLMLADLLARTVAQPVEVPIGIVTAVIGAPFFLWLMRQRGAARGGMNR